MSRSVEQHAQSRKGKNVLQTCPPPGPKLWSLIEVAARSQPVYRVADGLPVPRLTWTAEAAAHRDIGGNRLVDIAEHLAYGGNESSQIRAVRRDVAKGRRRWVAVGAWPWWAVARATSKPDLRGGLPSEWWEIDEVSETLSHYVRTA